jgi:glycosyltransferase involved in cell wall biosynthesis
MATVDILLATYNGEKYIDALLTSLTRQSFTDWRLIVRDDNSTDGTLQRIEWFKKYINPNVVILPTESRAGIKGNFSLLLEYSTAPYVMLCDQDDVWLSRKIAVSMAAIQKMDATKPALVHTDLIVVDKDLDTISNSFLEYSGMLGQYSTDFKSELVQNVVTGCTMLMNRKLVELATPIPNSAIMHDWWIALVSAALGNTVYLPDTTILYRQHGKNDTGATPFNLATVIRKMRNLKGIRGSIMATEIQAAVFLARYRHLLPEEVELLKVYSTLNNKPILQRKVALRKLGLDKHSRIRNIGFYLCV